MSSYSSTEKFFHRIYLSNYFISKATLEMEGILYGAQAKKLEVEECVFITGLARSGTTALMRKIFQTGEYASLQYSNMPMLLAPNLWNKQLTIEKHERAHKDGILVDGNSPEEFDEYFWKVFLKDSYIKEGLHPHEVEEKVLEKYMDYIALICLSKQKFRYISKNNNSILRLSALKKISGNRIIILFREPVSHAASLLKLHKSFTHSQKDDSFALDYFNFLGHHEFGLGHKPFMLTENFIDNKDLYDKNTIEYWLSVWINYYAYLINNFHKEYLLVSFADLINDPKTVFDYITKHLGIKSLPVSENRHNPSSYPEIGCNKDLLKKALSVYEQLETLKYN